MSELLTDHAQIRNWVSARAGSPAKIDVPDGHGGFTTQLRLTFGQRMFTNDADESRDQIGGIELITWKEWFEEFEQHQLALRVPITSDDTTQSAYQLDKRSATQSE